MNARTAAAVARVAVWLSVVALAGGAATAQGLGDAAAKERRRRDTQERGGSAKVLTNDDLPPAGAASTDAAHARSEGGASKDPGAAKEAGATKQTGAASATAASAAAAPASSAEDESHERALLEAHWRERFAIARERLAVADARAWTDGYRIEYYNGVAVRVRTRERVETDELKSARQAMADLEEEFRRTGLPPGWARE